MDSGRGISDQTVSALLGVIADDHPGTFYAWKIHDGAEDRAWLSLSEAEAAEWESLVDGRVTIVAWDLPGAAERSSR